MALDFDFFFFGVANPLVILSSWACLRYEVHVDVILASRSRIHLRRFLLVWRNSSKMLSSETLRTKSSSLTAWRTVSHTAVTVV